MKCDFPQGDAKRCFDEENKKCQESLVCTKNKILFVQKERRLAAKFILRRTDYLDPLRSINCLSITFSPDKIISIT